MGETMTITVDREAKTVTVTVSGIGRVYRGDYLLYKVFSIIQKFMEGGKIND